MVSLADVSAARAANVNHNMTSSANGSSMSTEVVWPPSVERVLLTVLLSIATLLTTGGNCLVLGAIATSRKLRSRTNYFVFSLAVADLTVSVLVMPFSVVYQLYGAWKFGWVFCYFWISCDVMCCTASILHLCVISMDRYLAITEPLTYKVTLSRQRAFAMIAAVWLSSSAISFIPIYMGWFADGTVQLHKDSDQCGLFVNRTYAVISSTLSFYAPLVVMIFAYLKIFRIAHRQRAEIARQEKALTSHFVPPPSSQSSNHVTNNVGTGGGGAIVRCKSQHSGRSFGGRDSKALKTLGTLMGLFCVCWLPFFIVYLLTPFCTDCYMPVQLVLVITWLGYANSFINPFVYAFLQRDFRQAFKRILLCQSASHPSSAYYSQARSSVPINRVPARTGSYRQN